MSFVLFFFFFQAEDGIRDYKVTGVQTCALPIWPVATYSEAKRMMARPLPPTLLSMSTKRDWAEPIFRRSLLLGSTMAIWTPEATVGAPVPLAAAGLSMPVTRSTLGPASKNTATLETGAVEVAVASSQPLSSSENAWRPTVAPTVASWRSEEHTSD